MSKMKRYLFTQWENQEVSWEEMKEYLKESLEIYGRLAQLSADEWKDV